MNTNASKTKVMSALIPGKQRQTVLLRGEPLGRGDVDKFKCLGTMFIAKETRSTFAMQSPKPASPVTYKAQA